MPATADGLVDHRCGDIPIVGWRRGCEGPCNAREATEGSGEQRRHFSGGGVEEGRFEQPTEVAGGREISERVKWLQQLPSANRWHIPAPLDASQTPTREQSDRKTAREEASSDPESSQILLVVHVQRASAFHGIGIAWLACHRRSRLRKEDRSIAKQPRRACPPVF